MNYPLIFLIKFFIDFLRSFLVWKYRSTVYIPPLAPRRIPSAAVGGGGGVSRQPLVVDRV
jgi:hypothetical protein